MKTTWKEIEQLAKMAMENGCNFSVDITEEIINVRITQRDGESSVSLKPPLSPDDWFIQKPYYPQPTWVGTDYKLTCNTQKEDN